MAWTRDQMAAIAAADLKDGDYVNLGIGIPTLVSQNLPEGMNVTLQAENGILGLGPLPYEGQQDPDLINASKQAATLIVGAAVVDSTECFGMIRAGRIDVTMLGAMEVSGSGDLANWQIPGKLITGMGGAMDLVAGAKRVVVLTDHVSKNGSAKIVEQCSLPLTGVGCVDQIITDLAVFDVVDGGLVLRRIAPDVTEEELRSKTGADFTVDLEDKNERSCR